MRQHESSIQLASLELRPERPSDADRLRLVVLADNDIDVGFYESRGFERIDEREDTTFGVTEFVYEKGL